MGRKNWFSELGLDVSANWEEIEEAYEDLKDIWDIEKHKDKPRHEKRALKKLRNIERAFANLKIEFDDSISVRKEIDGTIVKVPEIELGKPKESSGFPGVNESRLLVIWAYVLGVVLLSTIGLTIYTIRESDNLFAWFGSSAPTETSQVPLVEIITVEPVNEEDVEIIDGQIILKKDRKLASSFPITEEEMLLRPEVEGGVNEGAQPELEDPLEIEEINYAEKDKVLVLAGKSPVSRRIVNQTPKVVEYASKCNISKVKEELDSGAEINTADDRGDTILAWATKRGCDEIVEMLVKRGAEINTKAVNGFSPYVWARVYKRKKIAKLLKSNGAVESPGSYWWRNDEDQYKNWIERGVEAHCRDGRCGRE